MDNIPYLINTLSIGWFLTLFALVVLIISCGITSIAFLSTRFIYLRKRMPADLRQRIDYLEEALLHETENHVSVSLKLTRLRAASRAARAVLKAP